MAETITTQLDRFETALNEFAACVGSLPEPLFLTKIHDWSPRDIVAHLAGWNRAMITGCKQLEKGELPFYYIDPGEDFSKINATFVQEIATTDRRALLAELRDSFRVLRRYVEGLDPGQWRAGTGVRDNEGQPLTIQNSIEALLGDYSNHRHEIEAWAAALPDGTG
jgi:hypothetical protein